MIVVSHDREFLDGLVDKVYEFGNQKVVEHLGGIYNFLEHKKMDSLRELERSTGTSTSMSVPVRLRYPITSSPMRQGRN